MRTTNVSAFTLVMAAGLCPLDNTREPEVEIDGQKLKASRVLSDRSWTAHFRKTSARWKRLKEGGDAVPPTAETPQSSASHLFKRHGLQGPIDDAFLDSFILVRPTGQPLNERIGAWVATQQAHAAEQWRSQFRGEARVKNDADVTPADIASSNLILWGDPRSNRLLAKIADRLPVRWSERGVVVGNEIYSADDHVLLFVYPNPLNPKRYVVLNSGFTFSEVGHLSNALQTPKLPDYAVVNVRRTGSPSPFGGMVTAGFFDEHWQVPQPPK